MASTVEVLEQVRVLSAQGKPAAAEEPLGGAGEPTAGDLEMLTARAEMATRRRDWERAEHQWLLVLNRSPVHPSAMAFAADAMRQQRKFDAAEQLLNTALLSHPNDRRIAELLAQVADGRGDWAESDRRWGDVVRRFPASTAAWSGQSNARMRRGDLAGAETIAAEAVGLFPHDPVVLSLHARLANHASNWPEAERRWERLRLQASDNPDYWHEQASALRRQNRASDAHALLLKAASLFPDHRQIAWLHALVACDLSLWSEASMLLNRLAAAYPEDRRIQERAIEANWRAARITTAACDPHLALRPALDSTTDDYRRLMLRFEAFGTDDEFALTQRYFYAEPMGLLRWAEMGTADLARALGEDFREIGEPGNTALMPRRYFSVRDLRFGFSSNTWITADHTDCPTFFEDQCNRLKLLRRQLLETVEKGERILIYEASLDEPIDEVARLHAAIRKLGQAPLLYVRKSDSTHAAGKLERWADGLFVGYLKNLFGADNPRIDYPEWLNLLRKVAVSAHGVEAATAESLPGRDSVDLFESLNDTSEFGQVQLSQGAQPLDILRWTPTKLANLVDAFEQGLAGVGELEHTGIVCRVDYRAVDRRYNLSVRLFASVGSDDRANVLTEQCRQMVPLREKLLADLAAGDKIFVHHTAVAPPLDALRALHRAMQRHGSSTLFNVRPETQDQPNGTIEQIAPGLLVGYIGRPLSAEGNAEARHQSWLDLCLKAESAVRSAMSNPAETSGVALPKLGRNCVSLKLDKTEIVAHFDEAFAKAARFEDPYLLYYFKPFPDHVFNRILEHLPESRHYSDGKHPDGIRLDGSSARLGLVLKEETLRGLPSHQQEFWNDMNTILRSNELREVIKKWHAPALTKRFKTPLPDIPAFPLPLLIRDLHFYRIGIHPDTPIKVITVQMYLPRDERLKHLGTEIYARSADGKFQLSRKLEYLPNSGYSFGVTENSWHGVRVLTEEAAVRDSMMLVYYVTPQDEY